MDYIEKICPFDTSEYSGVPDTAPCGKSVDVKSMLAEYDGILASDGEEKAALFLNGALSEAEKTGDWRAELSFVNEWLGLSRRLSDREAGIRAVNRAQELIKKHGMGRTVSGATVLLNAATTLDCFGCSREALPVFLHVSRVFSESLAPGDYRFAGLYNNMGGCFASAGERENAKKYYLLALKVLEACPGTLNERAVTMCSLADLSYAADPLSPEVGEYMEKAWEALSSPDNKKDAYFRFNASKCLPAFDMYGYFIYASRLREMINELS